MKQRFPLLLSAVIFSTIVIFSATPASAQGCSQCAQAVGQTPPATRAAYRRAIAVMVLAGTGVFTAGVLTLRRFR